MQKIIALLLLSPITYADVSTETLKEKLETCSSSEINVIDILYTGENLDKDCLTKEFNKIFKTQKKIDWLGQEYKVEIKDYESNQEIKTITSIWGDRCGEKCIPTKDWIYEVGNKFWYLAPYTDGAVDILMYGSKEPLIIKYALYTTTAVRNNLIHIPNQKSYSLGSGDVEILDIDLNQMQWTNNGRKTYFLAGGAHWYNSKSNLNFKNETLEWEWINTSDSYRGNQCMEKERYLELSGMDKNAFINLEEVCYAY